MFPYIGSVILFAICLIAQTVVGLVIFIKGGNAMDKGTPLTGKDLRLWTILWGLIFLSGFILAHFLRLPMPIPAALGLNQLTIVLLSLVLPIFYLTAPGEKPSTWAIIGVWTTAVSCLSMMSYFFR